MSISPRTIKRCHLTAAIIWFILAIPSVIWWKNSVLWVIIISIYANIVGHLSGYSPRVPIRLLKVRPNKRTPNEDTMMNHVEHYHDWLRDAHAMEKQAESMLESMASRIDNYPDVRARIEQHINETKRQITLLEEILDRNDISRSVLKDSMSKMAALGQSIGGMFPSDEIVKGSISGYVFEQFEIACYTSLLAAAKKAGDVASVPAIETILAEEREMADWLIRHIPQTTEQFLLRSDASGVEAKK